MKKLRVLVLMHEELVPPETLDGASEKEMAEWKTEFDVLATLREMGHDAFPVGVKDDLGVLRAAIQEKKPDVAFNLLEEFHGVGLYDQHVVSYLELMRLPYTGCNPRGLTLTHDKPLMKKILSYHRIPTPRFVTFRKGNKVRPTRRLRYPLLVKSAIEDASLGISQASVVTNDQKLVERVEFVFDQIGTEAMVEEYIEGRELYVGVMGNHRLATFPIWEMIFANLPEGVPRIATARVKWNEKYQKKIGLETRAAEDLPPGSPQKIAALCKRIYRHLSMSGYGRMDLRLAEDGKIYVLEANANPNLAYGEDFAESAEAMGIEYEVLLTRILNLGLNYEAPWKQ